MSTPRSRTTRTPGAPVSTPTPTTDTQAPTGDQAATTAAVTTTETPPADEPVAVAQSGAPNAIDVDPKAIRGPVLTNQGWVCPDETGRRAPDSLKA